MKVIILHQTVTKHDAIGNDIEIMQDIFRKNSIECFIYADNCFNSGLQYINRDELNVLVKQKDNFMIYHHSAYWKEGEEILDMANCKFVIRYHNIIPEHFFQPYDSFYYQQCALGREQTGRFQKKYPDCVWLCDSRYNGQDLTEVRKQNIYFCPPFHKIDEWKNNVPEPKILNELVDSKIINLMFVGRIVPNKGYLLLLEILRIFRLNYEEDIVLRIIGKFDDGISKYNKKLLKLIRQYGLKTNVKFIGEVTDSTLMSYYLGSDIFVCVSEHEGFCMPILEAQSFRLPIIALNACAVPETCDRGAILLDRNLEEYAAAIHLMYKNRKYIDYCVEFGKLNYELKFSRFSIEQTFLDFCKNVLGGIK